MSNVIDLEARRAERQREHSAARVDPELLKLLRISDEIDGLILKHVRSGDIDPRDLAGLLAHRLGTLMRHVEGKATLWDICERVAKKQAAIE